MAQSSGQLANHLSECRERILISPKDFMYFFFIGLNSCCWAEEIAKLFPSLFGQPSAMLVPNGSDTFRSDQKLKIGVVLSGGQAPGGHNVISVIFDYLQDRAKGSIPYGFRGGPSGIMKCKYVELTAD